MNKIYAIMLLVLLLPSQALALDSYRFLHVTIDTPIYIFIFLLFFVLSPFILMAVLAWRFANKKKSS